MSKKERPSVVSMIKGQAQGILGDPPTIEVHKQEKARESLDELTVEYVSSKLGIKPIGGAIQMAFRARGGADLLIMLELKKIADRDYRGNMTATIFSLLKKAIDNEEQNRN